MGSLAETHQLIFNMTFMGHNLTLRGLDLRLNFNFDFSSFLAYLSMRPDERNTMAFDIFFHDILRSKVVLEKTFFDKRSYFDFDLQSLIF